MPCKDHEELNSLEPFCFLLGGKHIRQELATSNYNSKTVVKWKVKKMFSMTRNNVQNGTKKVALLMAGWLPSSPNSPSMMQHNWGTTRARRGAELLVLSAVETKVPGYFVTWFCVRSTALSGGYDGAGDLKDALPMVPGAKSLSQHSWNNAGNQQVKSGPSIELVKQVKENLHLHNMCIYIYICNICSIIIYNIYTY